MRSGLTIRGRCLLAAGVAAALCSFVLGERDLLRIAVFVAALPLLAAGFSGLVRHRLRARREVLPMRVAVDEPTTVRLHVRSWGRLPLSGLELTDAVPHALGKRPFFRLATPPPREGTALEYEVRPTLRGIHQLGPLRSRVTDPFGLSVFQRELAGQERLIATPQVVRLTGLPPGSGAGVGERGASQLRAGHDEEDITVRHYRHGDDMRRVHWKSTARRDELMVRSEERPWRGGTTILLDTRPAAHRGTGQRSSLELAISAAASICLHLRRLRQPARLVTTDGLVLSEQQETDGVRGTEALLDALAALQPATTRDLVYRHDPGGGQELIAILGATTVIGVEELTKARPTGVRSHALLLDIRAWNSESTDGGFDPQVTARRLRAAGWSTSVVDGPRAPLSAAWSQLCGSTPQPGVA